MKYEDLKCEFCDGKSETEKFVEPYGDSPVTCTFCEGTGIDQEQLKIAKVERSEEVKKEPTIESKESGESSHCPACGSFLITVRGKYPNDTKRKTCPQCILEKFEDLQSEIESLRKELQTARDYISLNDGQVENWEKENEKLEARVKELESKLASAYEEGKALTKEVARLEAKLSPKEE